MCSPASSEVSWNGENSPSKDAAHGCCAPVLGKPFFSPDRPTALLRATYLVVRTADHYTPVYDVMVVPGIAIAATARRPETAGQPLS
jgi:hypothetical protein